jgi:hypothetical protein
VPIDTVYPGHYALFGRPRYEQILPEYLARRRRRGCPSDPKA